MTIKEKKKKLKVANPNKCLGPVADLEKHLPINWWQSIFNSIYLKTDADIYENEEATQQDVDYFLSAVKPKPNDSILDLCCGQGRHSLELSKRGFQYLTGIDRSRYLIRLAKSRAQKRNATIKFSEGDARKIRLPNESIDHIMVMGNSFGYFEQKNDDIKFLKEANRVLRSEGTFYLDIPNAEWIKEHFEKRSWEWIDEELMVCRERHLSADQTRLISREVVIHAEKGVITDQFYAERLYTFEELKELLKATGFENIQEHNSLTGVSTRNQDLGMMANRTIISASAKEKKATAPVKAQKKITFTVLMGDPKQPDSVKRHGTFTDDDFVTIDRLKEALKGIGGFNFVYFDDHKTMLQKFLQNPPEFVFNLCDEGWNNNAFLELHPPAYLEMLNIPYTGAGPACLAVCYNKATVRAIAHEMEILVPDEIWIDPENHSAAIPSVFPALIKPAYGDSSIGITQQAVVHNTDQVVAYFDHLRNTMPGVPILIQEFLTGSEFSVGIIGNGTGMEALPILEVDYSQLPDGLPKILGYESKWHPESPYCTKIDYKQAQLSEQDARYLVDSSMKLFQHLNCRDYARFDFRMNQHGEIKLLEVNPNPGWCWDGKMALMASFCGMDYPELLEKILRSGVERYSHH